LFSLVFGAEPATAAALWLAHRKKMLTMLSSTHSPPQIQKQGEEKQARRFSAAVKGSGPGEKW
jgi:dsDNA-binding SOS-regulon protein